MGRTALVPLQTPLVATGSHPSSDQNRQWRGEQKGSKGPLSRRAIGLGRVLIRLLEDTLLQPLRHLHHTNRTFLKGWEL
jgi:hypothetical protein